MLWLAYLLRKRAQHRVTHPDKVSYVLASAGCIHSEGKAMASTLHLQEPPKLPVATADPRIRQSRTVIVLTLKC